MAAMDEFYKSYYIHTLVDLNLDSDCWVPKVEIIWEEQGVPHRQHLVGPSDLFKILDDAEIYAVEMAKGWIDNEIIQRRDPMTELNVNKPDPATGLLKIAGRAPNNQTPYSCRCCR
jgi:hypothetical protein